MQNFGVTNKEHYGMLWYFLEWSIASILIQVKVAVLPSKPIVCLFVCFFFALSLPLRRWIVKSLLARERRRLSGRRFSPR